MSIFKIVLLIIVGTNILSVAHFPSFPNVKNEKQRQTDVTVEVIVAATIVVMFFYNVIMVAILLLLFRRIESSHRERYEAEQDELQEVFYEPAEFFCKKVEKKVRFSV